MEYVYDSYTKVVQDKTYFFIKKFMAFPEYLNSCNVLVGYGMHTDFDTACKIATVDDLDIRKQLLNEIESGNPSAKVINMLEISFKGKKIGNESK
jgi:hypothetical protein